MSNPYYMLFALLAVLAVIQPQGRNGRILWVLLWVLLVAFVGLRHHVGMDWNNYLSITRYIDTHTLKQGLGRAEPGFALLTKISSELDMGIYGANMAVALLFVSGLFRMCAQTSNRWLGVAVAFPVLIVVVANSATRQCAAIGVLMFLIAEWDRASLYRRIALIGLAGTFHYSALIFLSVVAIESQLSPYRRLLLALVVLIATIYLSIALEPDTRYVSTYVTGQTKSVISQGALLHVMLNAIPGMLLLLYPNLRRRLALQGIILYLSALAVVLLPMSFAYSTASGRLSYYLYPVSIGVLASFPSLFKTIRVRNLVNFSLLFLLFAQLWVWLNYANNRVGYLNYENVLFVPAKELEI